MPAVSLEYDLYRLAAKAAMLGLPDISREIERTRKKLQRQNLNELQQLLKSFRKGG
jgi:hypothetical protein